MSDKINSKDMTLIEKEELIKDIENHKRVMKLCNICNNFGRKSKKNIPVIYVDGNPYEITEMVS